MTNTNVLLVMILVMVAIGTISPVYADHIQSSGVPQALHDLDDSFAGILDALASLGDEIVSVTGLFNILNSTINTINDRLTILEIDPTVRTIIVQAHAGNGNLTTLTATCDGDETLTGGGHHTQFSNTFVRESYPDNNGWSGVFKHSSGSTALIKIYAICMTP